MSWSFAIVNKRLAEIYFDKNRSGIKFRGHCFVKKNEYKTKHELAWIKEDTRKFKFVYRNNHYRPIGQET
ncbi:MAG: hypothetical protein UY21_C0009G0044 [Microgenomates group bacterium GW2011_GWA1_48_10]|nr:MAG: hypothetical protein UY21_C0009G0044 [Microgenomates group bacterium GW2011_GWA1_48_10]